MLYFAAIIAIRFRMEMELLPVTVIDEHDSAMV